MFRLGNRCYAIGALLCAACGIARASEKGTQQALEVFPAEGLVEGSPLRITVRGEKKPVVTVAGKEVPLYDVETADEPSLRSWEGIAGLPLGYGKSEVTLRARFPSRASDSIERTLRVGRGTYETEHLSVDPRHVQPPKKELKRIAREVSEIGAIYRKITRQKFWHGPWLHPVAHPSVTSPYGTQRLYNGEPRGFHSGVDFKAALGDPILAPTGGLVVLAKDLYFTGWTVILDHGYGVCTVYAHLSELLVRKGQVVKPGQKLGLAGMSGRATGPHLHWTVAIRGAKVSPLEALRILR